MLDHCMVRVNKDHMFIHAVLHSFMLIVIHVKFLFSDLIDVRGAVCIMCTPLVPIAYNPDCEQFTGGYDTYIYNDTCIYRYM